MRLNALAIAAICIIGAIALVGINIGDLAMSGYDGIEATINRYEHNYGDIQAPNIDGLGTGSSTFDPSVNLVAAFDPNGIHIDIQQPNILDSTIIDQIEQTEEFTGDDGKTYDRIRTWEVQRVKLEIGAHLFTTGFGDASMIDVNIWIKLVENPYTVFMEPDESEAYILNVYTSRPTETGGGVAAQVVPLAGGVDVEINPVRTAEIPQWILDSGYTTNLAGFKDVEFPIHIVAICRQVILLWVGEAEVKMWFGVDVLLFGYWEQVKEHRELEREIPGLFDFLNDLLNIIMAPLGFALVIVCVIGTVVVLWKAPGAPLKIFGVAAIWIAALFVLILFGVLAI